MSFTKTSAAPTYRGKQNATAPWLLFLAGHLWNACFNLGANSGIYQETFLWRLSPNANLS